MKPNPSTYATIAEQYAASRAGADADQTVTPSRNTPRIWVTKETLRTWMHENNLTSFRCKLCRRTTFKRIDGLRQEFCSSKCSNRYRYYILWQDKKTDTKERKLI